MCVCVCVDFNAIRSPEERCSTTVGHKKMIFLLSISSYMIIFYSISLFSIIILLGILGMVFLWFGTTNLFCWRSGALYGLIVFITLYFTTFLIIDRFYCLLVMKIQAHALFVCSSVGRTSLGITYWLRNNGTIKEHLEELMDD